MSSTRRTAIVALLLLAAASLALATGAVVVDGPADTLADERVAIQPADGPNGNYAYLNDDDEIVVDVSPTNPNLPADFEGVNPDSTGSIPGVFTVAYTADEYAHVWIEHDGSEEVTFVAGGESVEGEANNVTLAPNESVAVGLAFDARGEPADAQLGADEFSIHARVAEPESVESSGYIAPTTTTVRASGPSERAFEADDVRAGDPVAFDLDRMALDGTNVTFDGMDLTLSSPGDASFEAAGRPEPFAEAGALDAPEGPAPVAYLSLAYDLDPDDVESATFRFSADRDHLADRGVDPEDLTVYRRGADGWSERDVSVVDPDTAAEEGLDGDRVHFRATTGNLSVFAVATHRPRFEVREASLADDAVAVGEETAVNATVANAGGADGERAVTVTLDGDAVAETTVALDPGNETAVTLPVAPDEPGQYEVAVAGTDVGTLSVTDPAADDGSGTDGSGTDGSGTDDSADDGDDSPDDGAGESDSGADDGDDSPEGTGTPGDGEPVEEPGGIGLDELAGLVGLLIVTVATLVLVRRMPRNG